jgi:hypothetical protein
VTADPWPCWYCDCGGCPWCAAEDEDCGCGHEDDDNDEECA